MSPETPHPQELRNIAGHLRGMLRRELELLDDVAQAIDRDKLHTAMNLLDQVQMHLAQGVVKSDKDLRRFLIHRQWQLPPEV